MPGHVLFLALVAWPVVVVGSVGGDGCSKSFGHLGHELAKSCKVPLWTELPCGLCFNLIPACLPPTYLIQTCQKCHAGGPSALLGEPLFSLAHARHV